MDISCLRLTFAAVLLETNLSAHLYLLNESYLSALPPFPRRRAASMTLFLIDMRLHVRSELSLHENGEPPHFVTNELNVAKDTL